MIMVGKLNWGMGKKFQLLLLEALILTMTGMAQTGGLYVSNFKLNNEAEKWCWAFAQDKNQHMVIGVAEGVIIFDGINQTLVNLPFFPTNLKFDEETNNIYVSGFENIGVLNYMDIGSYEFKSLYKEEELKISNILTLNNEVYFVSPNQVLKFNRDDYSALAAISAGDELIEQAYILNNKLHIVKDYFIYYLEGKQWVESDFEFPVDDIAFVLPYGKDKVFAGSQENKIYILKSGNYSEKTIKAAPFFDNNLLIDGKCINDTLLVISSIASGVAVINTNNFTVHKHMSYFNGLPDEEIRSMFIDQEGGIWISHQFGISRIDMQLNIENYSDYPGLKGTPIAVKTYNQNIYIGTSDGLFTLREIKDYDEFEVSVNYSYNVEVEVEPSKVTDEKSITQDKNNKRGLFARRKKTDNKDIELSSSHVAKQKKTVRKSRTKIIKKRSLKAISHEYHMVEGINDKCRKLEIFENSLFVAGNNGLYLYDGNKAQKIIKDVYIVDIYKGPALDAIYISSNNGLYKVFKSGDEWEVDHFAESTDSYINSVCYEGDEWVIAFSNVIIRATLEDKKIKIKHQFDLEQSSAMTFFLKRHTDSTLLYSGKKVYHFNNQGGLDLIHEYSNDYQVINNQSDYVWKKTNGNWTHQTLNNSAIHGSIAHKLKLFKSIRTIAVENDKIVWFIDGDNQIIKINEAAIQDFAEVTLNITKLEANNKRADIQQILTLPSKQTHIQCGLSAPFYLKQMGVKYSYRLQGMDKEWSTYSESPIIDIKYIPPGTYTLQVKAKNDLGKESAVQSIAVKVSKPFTQSFWFILMIITATIVIAYFAFKIRMRKLENDKALLEQRVKERTRTIEKQKGILEKQHDEIHQSIRYAERIQRAILPHDEIMEAVLPKHFVLFLPRDIVSGDFYFFKPIGNRILFVAADCTGHGVPGAFMSMLGISFLSEITSHLNGASAADILDHLRDKIKITLGQTSINSTQKDGMDLSLCIIDPDKREIEFAGAYNPLFIVRNKVLETVKADRQPVAVHYVETDFTNHIIPIEKGDMFYMFSDGYPDQIGGPKERKFMTKNFKTLLAEISDKSIADQKQILHDRIQEWKGDKMQIDDILVVGFTID